MWIIWTPAMYVKSQKKVVSSSQILFLINASWNVQFQIQSHIQNEDFVKYC